MRDDQNSTETCGACKDGVGQPFPFSMSFQPIVDVDAGRIYAFEALVRGINGESAGSMLSRVTEANRYAFDQGCRVKAITLAKRLGLDQTDARLSINFMPGAVYSPAACIQLTLKTAREVSFPLDRLVFEITEAEEVRDRQHLMNIVHEYRRHGFKLALDDFGAGYSGLNLFVDVTPDVLKMDMDLTRNLHRRPTSLAVVRSTAELCAKLGVALVAEGVETVEEFEALRECGIKLMQGYLLAKPGFERLPGVVLPDGRAAMTTGAAARVLPVFPAFPILPTFSGGA